MSTAESMASPPARYTPASLFRRATGASSAPSTPESSFRSSSVMMRCMEEDRPILGYDREVDLVGTKAECEGDFDLEFMRVLAKKYKATGGHPLFALPPSVKRRIYGFCFPNEARKINLSPYFATKAVFPEGYFANPWDILDSVAGGLEASSQLRNELMTYFWTAYHFHVTLNEFSGPKLSPLSHVWLIEHLDAVQHLTIEVDFTRFGCSHLRDAKRFGYNMTKTTLLFAIIVRGLGDRPAHSNISQIHLMCRRYSGARPPDHLWVTETDARYCPVEALNICNNLMALRGIIDQCRVSGFPMGFSLELLDTLFKVEETPPSYFFPIEEAWPVVTPQISLPFSEVRSPIIPFPSFEQPSVTSSLPASYSLRLRNSASTRTLIEEIEDEMNSRSPTLVSEGSHVLGNFSDAGDFGQQELGDSVATDEQVRQDEVQISEMTTSEHPDSSPHFTSCTMLDTSSPVIIPTPSLTSNEMPASLLAPSPVSAPLEDLEYGQISTLLAPSLLSPLADDHDDSPAAEAVSTPDLSSDLLFNLPTTRKVSNASEGTGCIHKPEEITGVTATTPPSPHLVPPIFGEGKRTPGHVTPPAPLTPLMAPKSYQDQRHIRTPVSPKLRPLTPMSRSRIPRAMAASSPTPKTPNRMNALNEQDPAFISTLSAMRSFDKRPNSKTRIASPAKKPDSLGIILPGPSKRKYFSFVNRLRGVSNT
ncbi:uncharacterized protein L3040_005124 [Drepanopeziza brunnea f. sp. 'multigermtubi']|uniref:uncharacterized protein n=1 Tax=Drepanopeziza brunnea f. sp. 'multigermtubi' TaxID=698441 RepID=UPI00239F21FF|nr:hypothetical protein L3040_005124 [Drepanopeziza brunnea f. sp. 'multigermtubi']